MNIGFLELLSSQIHFHTAWIGSHKLNKKGLHKARIRLSDHCLSLRKLAFPSFELRQKFDQTGYLVLGNFLPEDSFHAILKEAHQLVAQAETRYAFAKPQTKGFGSKQPFPGGFDRYDGGTLNRFFNLCPETTPACSTFVRHRQLLDITRKTSGSFARSGKFSIYQTIHGNDQENEDIQKAWHRDSFQSAIKLWFYLDEVTPEQGPFEYIPGSHKMTKQRMEWEYQRSVQASAPGGNTGGSFRISEDEFSALRLEEPIQCAAPANTLVIADVRGFHRRGDARPGSRRLSIYGNLRPYPFSPIPLD